MKEGVADDYIRDPCLILLTVVAGGRRKFAIDDITENVCMNKQAIVTPLGKGRSCSYSAGRFRRRGAA